MSLPPLSLMFLQVVKCSDRAHFANSKYCIALFPNAVIQREVRHDRLEEIVDWPSDVS